MADGRTVTLRKAAGSDAAAILENINAVGAEEIYLLVDHVPKDLEEERRWIEGFDGVRSTLIVAEAPDGKIVGQADAHRGEFPKNRHTATLGIAVRDGWREAGLGRILMIAVLDWMRVRGIEKACLEVFSTNARAIALYRRLGFEEEGRRVGQFRVRGEPVDDVVMAMWLS